MKLPEPGPGGSSRRRPHAARLAFVFGIALLVRLVFLVLIADTGCLAINLDGITDMEAFHRWALQIRAGDLLGRQDFHPYHPWQAGIGTEPEWLAWYGPGVFHQDPLYPYWVALIYLVAPAAPLSVVVVQLLLGAAGAAGIAHLGERLFGGRVGLASGLLAALYAPFIFYESLLLRDTLLVSLTVLFLVLLESARPVSSPVRWAAVGVVAGLICLAKASILVFVGWMAAWLALAAEFRGRRRAAALFSAGFLLALAPAVARNLAVGAPPLKTTTRGAIAFINGNNPYHPGIGWFDGDDPRVSSYARDVLHRTEARLVPTIGTVLESWRGRVPELAALQLRKLAYFLAPFEMPNNASFAYFRLNSPVLAAGLPTFWLVSPLALLGLLATARRWRELVPYYAYLAAGIAVTVAFYVIARFRIPLLPLFLVFAGAGAVHLVSLAQEARWARLAAAGGLVVALLAVNSAFNYPDRELVTPLDFAVAAREYAGRGELARAGAELERGIEIFPGSVPLWISAAAVRERQGDIEGSIRAWESITRIGPRSERAGRELERLRRLREARP